MSFSSGGLDQRLLRHAIPEARKAYARSDCARYALSVGLGQDPLDAAQLAYVDVDRPLRVLPTMAIVLGSPGFWLMEPSLRIDIAKVLHGEQRLWLHAPLPDRGELVGTSEVAQVLDKGAGKAALVVTRTRLRDAASGQLHAVMESTTFLRDAGGFGGQAGALPPASADPMRPADREMTVAIRPEQALWYRLNGDLNPIHADPAVARQGGFERPILHGLCTLGVACQSMLRAWAQGEPSALRELACRFVAPVFPGETLVTELWDAEGAFRCRAAERGVVVLRGRAVLGAAA
jgi:acyl dehydratase